MILPLKIGDIIQLHPTLPEVEITQDNIVEYVNDIRFDRYPEVKWIKKAERDLAIVKITNSGCLLLPNNSVWVVDKLDNFRIQSLPMSFVTKKWAKKFSGKRCTMDSEGVVHASRDSIFGEETIKGGVSNHHFKKYGYFQDGTKTNKFTEHEYEHFERHNRSIL